MKSMNGSMDGKAKALACASVVMLAVSAVLVSDGMLNFVSGANLYMTGFAEGTLEPGATWLAYPNMVWILAGIAELVLSALSAAAAAFVAGYRKTAVSRPCMSTGVIYGGILVTVGIASSVFGCNRYANLNPAKLKIKPPSGYINPGTLWLAAGLAAVAAGLLLITLVMIAASHYEKPFAVKVKRVFMSNWQLYILMLPAIAATCIFNYAPMYGVQIAFKNFSTRLGIWGSSWVGAENFRKFFSNPLFWPMVKNTLSLTLYGLATFPLSVIVALLINELRGTRFKKTVQMISYAPHFLSVVVVCGLITLLFGRANGIINNVLSFFGGKRIDFITLPSAFKHLYVWSGVWQSLGWGTIVYLAALSGVSPELVEAAMIDGATRLDIVRHVNIPAIMPTVIIMFIMATGSILSVGAEKVLLLQNDLNKDSSRVISLYVYQIGIAGGNPQYSLASAIGLFNNAVNFIVVIFVNLISRRVSEVSLW